MGPLCTRKMASRRGLSWWERFSQSDVHALMTKELDQLAPMGATLPVSPKDGASSNKRLGCFVERRRLAKGMEHHADAPWFFGHGPVPLTAFP
jgi:hypothetical protein